MAVRRIAAVRGPGAVAVLLCIGLAAVGCAASARDAGLCYTEENRTNPDNCGCAGPCRAGFVCTSGLCCDPGEHASDVENCGCFGPCPYGHRCRNGRCCDPDQHSEDPFDCGCMEVCAEGQYCIAGYCRCDERAHLFDNEDCACNGPCRPAGLTACFAGACICVPGQNLFNPDTCGCGPACPVGASCVEGRCVCPDGSIWCDGRCQIDSPSTSCACSFFDHTSDAANCGCRGPCGAGERCDEGRCTCDPNQHLDDSLNCGCRNVTCMNGHVCQAGVCVCPTGQVLCGDFCMDPPCCDTTTHWNDAANCACRGPCATGERCTNGQCVCDPLQHLEDSADCGCQTPKQDCKGGRICQAGQCVCPPGFLWCRDDDAGGALGTCRAEACCVAADHLTDNLNCGCAGPCPAGTRCEWNAEEQRSACLCDPLQHLEDSAACACDDDPCALNEVCAAGRCTCAAGYRPCTPTEGDLVLSGRPICRDGWLVFCPDCRHFCPGAEAGVYCKRVGDNYGCCLNDGQGNETCSGPIVL